MPFKDLVPVLYKNNNNHHKKMSIAFNIVPMLYPRMLKNRLIIQIYLDKTGLVKLKLKELKSINFKI